MCKNRKYCVTIKAEEYEAAYLIIELYYDRGDLDSVSVNYQSTDHTYQVWLQCTTDDLEIIKQELRDNNITLL